MDPIELKRRGNRSLAAKDFEAAKRAFSELIAQRPTEADGYAGLARVLERTGEHREVIQLLQPVVSQIRSQKLLRALGDSQRVLAARGEREWLEPAITTYGEYLKERRDPVTLFHLAELFRLFKKDYSESLRLLKESWDADPGSRSVYEAALESARRIGSLEEIRLLQEHWRPQLRD
jgi:tetratricopeptide (TPR) repeat protein